MKSETSFRVFFLKQHRKNGLKNIFFPSESVFLDFSVWPQGHRTWQNAHCAVVRIKEHCNHDTYHLNNFAVPPFMVLMVESKSIILQRSTWINSFAFNTLPPSRLLLLFLWRLMTLQRHKEIKRKKAATVAVHLPVLIFWGRIWSHPPLVLIFSMFAEF